MRTVTIADLPDLECATLGPGSVGSDAIGPPLPRARSSGSTATVCGAKIGRPVRSL
jgi:hypothetical protein